MSARTDFAVLDSRRIARQMGALFPQPLSKPAERVEVEHECTVARFSRTLDERHPYERSSTAHIVPMDAAEPIPARDWALYLVGVIALIVVFMFRNGG